MPTLTGGKNLDFLVSNFDFDKAKKQIKQGFVLEGGSGSGKTYDIISFFIQYCYIFKNKDILIFRQTYADLKKTVLKDFIKILQKYNIYNSDKNHTKSHPQRYNLYGNIIYFSGLDGMGSHGERHDIIWGNEGMELDFSSFQQLNQRCNEAFFIDYNPCFTDHWIFNNIITRPDTHFCHSTQLDNAFLPEGQRNEILAYEPTAENIKNGTADSAMWSIYGLGLRTAVKGLIFNNISYIEEFPEINYSFGLDFGFTNDPTAFTKVGIKGNDLFLELMCYEPIDNAFAISEMMNTLNINRRYLITADSSDRYNDVSMCSELRNYGYNINKVNKGKGLNWSIGEMKKYKIHIVKDQKGLWVNAKREAENYKWREINGLSINEPLDKFNHFWDSARYGLLGQMNDRPLLIYR